MSKLPYPMRLLRSNKGVQQPAHVICVDSESDLEPTDDSRIIHHYKMGVAVHWQRARKGRDAVERWLDFDDLNTFWDWVETQVGDREKVYLFSHNLNYDLPTLDALRHLVKRDWLLIFICQQQYARQYKFGKPTDGYREYLEGGGEWGKYKGRKWRKTLICLDSLNIMRGSIADWGDLLGLPKLDMPVADAPKADWLEYNRRDVQILLLMVKTYMAFLSEHDLGNFKYTIAGQAFTAYRHRFMDATIFTHQHEETVSLEREGYYGGRVEPFYVGSPNVGAMYKVDVNSMYPAVMRDNDYPVCLVHHSRETDLPDLMQRRQHHCLIARVTLVIDEPAFPQKADKRNIYPTGTFQTVLCTPEIDYALERDWIAEVHEIAQYAARPIFTRYVDYFYDLKQVADDADDPLNRTMAKNYLNHLYGKFGQRGYKDFVSGTCDPDLFEVMHGIDAKDDHHFTRICAAGTVTYTWQEGEGRQSFVAVAAHVTAHGRMNLWQLIKQAGREHVFYVDTDCLCTDEKGYQNLGAPDDTTELGALKLEAMDYEPIFRAPKDYEFGGEIKRKGIPKQAERVGTNRYRVVTWPDMLSLWQMGVVDHYENIVITKRIRYEVNWGELGTDNWVRPYVL